MARADSRACKARGQGQARGIESCFYGLGVGFASVDSRGVALARGLAWLAWVRGVGELWRGLWQGGDCKICKKFAKMA